MLAGFFIVVSTISVQAQAQPADAVFWKELQTLCGKAFVGTLAAAPADDATFKDKTLVMHVRSCEQDRIRIPFVVGEDRSRTWVLTKSKERILLRHDHRHQDGTPDKVTMYGGLTTSTGLPTRQVFPADQDTVNTIPAAAPNVWWIEIIPGEHFTYNLRRMGSERYFSLKFDLKTTVKAPEAPWGWKDTMRSVPPRGSGWVLNQSAPWSYRGQYHRAVAGGSSTKVRPGPIEVSTTARYRVGPDEWVPTTLTSLNCAVTMPSNNFLILIMWNDTEIPLAFFISFRTHGTWLHGDKRGSIDRFHNRYGTPYMPPNESWHRYNAQKLRGTPLILDARQRKAVETAIRETCRIRKWALLAINVRTNHIHTVVTANRKPSLVLNAFKANATRQLRQDHLWPHSYSPWADKGSKRKLWNERSVARAIDYVLNGQGDDLHDFDDD